MPLVTVVKQALTLIDPVWGGLGWSMSEMAMSHRPQIQPRGEELSPRSFRSGPRLVKQK